MPLRQTDPHARKSIYLERRKGFTPGGSLYLSRSGSVYVSAIVLAQVITIVQPETLLKWHRRWVAKKWDFSARRTKSVGRRAVDAAVEKLVVQLAKDNAGWGYDRIVGALANLGH